MFVLSCSSDIKPVLRVLKEPPRKTRMTTDTSLITWPAGIPASLRNPRSSQCFDWRAQVRASKTYLVTEVRGLKLALEMILKTKSASGHALAWRCGLSVASWLLWVQGHHGLLKAVLFFWRTTKKGTRAKTYNWIKETPRTLRVDSILWIFFFFLLGKPI